MYIVRSGYGTGIGDSLQEAIENYEYGNDTPYDPKRCSVYEAKEVVVQRKFEILKENNQ